MFYTFLQTVVTTILLGDIFQRRYPQQFEQFFIIFSIHAINLLTKVEILMKKVLRILNTWIDANPSLSKIRNHTLKFIRKFKKTDLELAYVKEGIIYNQIIDNADFMIYSFIPEDNINSLSNYVNKKIIIPLENSAINNRINNYSKSDVKFMMVELKIQKTDKNVDIIDTFKIDLKTDNYDFYVVDNRFSKAFFKYYLRNMLNYTKEFKDDEKWSLKIIDHNVDMVIIDFTEKDESVLIEKDIYKIHF
jgi:hypothetical protein